ncbi:Protein of unknown function [Ruminococcaceae bacterium YRB3002]|nr:Protein of unknown function [Ruminococcaceae bacterium YRB3002]
MDNNSKNNDYSDSIVTIMDSETGEMMDFIYADRFELNGKTYAVLLTDEENEDDMEMLIMEQVEDENGEIMLQTIDEDKEDIIYDYYDELCDELFDEEEDNGDGEQ